MCEGNCCGKNYSNLCDCFKAGVKTECRTLISETILMFLGCLAIELCFEFGWYNNTNENTQSWLKESIISSGVSASYAVLTSVFLRIMHEKYHDKENGITQTQEMTYFNTANIISQLLSGVIAFGIGIAFDLAFHEILDNFEKNSRIALSIGIPVLMVTAKVLSRIGIFKAVDGIKCCCQHRPGYENLENADDYALIRV